MADDRGSRRDHASASYRRPPAATRFRKGQSGNPRGKPKGARNKLRSQGERLRSLMLAEAYRPIKVNENGQEITMPLAQAVLRTLAAAAAKGDARAQAMFLKLVSASEDIVAAIKDASPPETGAIGMTIIGEDGQPTGEIVYRHGNEVDEEG